MPFEILYLPPYYIFLFILNFISVYEYHLCVFVLGFYFSFCVPFRFPFGKKSFAAIVSVDTQSNESFAIATHPQFILFVGGVARWRSCTATALFELAENDKCIEKLLPFFSSSLSLCVCVSHPSPSHIRIISWADSVSEEKTTPMRRRLNETTFRKPCRTYTERDTQTKCTWFKIISAEKLQWTCLQC